MAGGGRPLPGCPARVGAGRFGVDGAEFVFHAADRRNAGNPVTEIFGFFCTPGWRETGGAPSDDDAVHTAAFEVPARSAIARLAHHADTPAGVAVIAARLRAVIAACPCTIDSDCAALDGLNFLTAIEHAAKQAGRRRGLTARLVTQAHYVAGRDGPLPELDQELTDRAIIRHDVPVTAKGEVGADVEFALTCYQIAARLAAALSQPSAAIIRPSSKPATTPRRGQEP